MSTPDLDFLLTIASMARSLRRLPDCDLGDAHLRQIVYRGARFSNVDVLAFDARALGNERMRREAFATEIEREAA